MTFDLRRSLLVSRSVGSLGDRCRGARDTAPRYDQPRTGARDTRPDVKARLARHAAHALFAKCGFRRPLGSPPAESPAKVEPAFRFVGVAIVRHAWPRTSHLSPKRPFGQPTPRRRSARPGLTRIRAIQHWAGWVHVVRYRQSGVDEATASAAAVCQVPDAFGVGCSELRGERRIFHMTGPLSLMAGE